MELVPLEPTDAILRTPSTAVAPRELRTKAFQEQLNELLDYVYGNNNKGAERDQSQPMTVGLSANQVGWNRRVSIVDLAISQRGIHDIHVLINPEISWHSKAVVDQSEGCVNLKTVWGVVPRWREVEVRALDRSGNKLTIRAKGWAARLLQHEIDHLDGMLLVDRLPDPTKAHAVAPDQMKAYNIRKNRLTWPHFIDVRHLLIDETAS